VVVHRSLQEPLPDLRPGVALDIRRFTTDDLDFVRLRHLPSEAKLCAGRLSLGHFGLVASAAGETAGSPANCSPRPA
jgi:hypothetical protein